MKKPFKNCFDPLKSMTIITGADSEDAAFDLFAQAKDMFRRGRFNLRKFLTNSRELQQRIDCAEGLQHVEPDVPKLSYSDETYAKVMLGAPVSSESEEHKILGVPWNPNSDSLLFDMSELAQLAKNLQPTKRNLVSLIGKFYDPLGFLAPVTVKFKILFQKLCQTKHDWDNLLPKEWKELVADLREGCPISKTRNYYNNVEGIPTSTILCGFCDASYAAVVYLVISTDTQTVVRFVVAKTRVAPLQSQTIPRMELLSAFLLAKLIVSVANSLRHNFSQLRVQCYTDSQVALYWIHGRNGNPSSKTGLMRYIETSILISGATAQEYLIQLTCPQGDSLLWNFLCIRYGDEDQSG